jgi:hypothetical protein
MGHSRLSYHRTISFAFYQHPIIAPKESQRNPGNLALFGIKNARRSARKHELVLSSRVNQPLAFRTTARLLDDYVPLGNHVVELPRSGKRLMILDLLGSLAPG